MLKTAFSRNIGLIVALLAIDAVFFTRTDAQRVTSVTLIVGFLLLSVTIYLCLRRLAAVGRLYGLSFGRHERRFALFGTGVIAVLIGLQSMGELSRRDIFLGLPLLAALYLYFSYGRGRSSRTGTDP